MKGRVIAFTGPRQPFEIHEFDVPEPEPGAIVLKITQAGICGSDLHAWRGDDQLTSYGRPEPPGRTIGHEGTGLVYKLGAGVTTDSLGKPIKEGDRIIYSAINPCGRCHRCLNGNHNWCPNLRTGLPFGQYPYFTGTYADFYYIRPTQPVFKVPDELPDEVLGFVNCAMGTVTEGLLRAGVKEGDYVVIQGAGGLGLNAVAASKDMGAHRVIVLDRLENRLDLAREFGADYTINVEQEWTTPEMRRQRVWELTDGRGADIWSDAQSCCWKASNSSARAAPLSKLATSSAAIRSHSTRRRCFVARRSWAPICTGPPWLPMLLETLVKKQGKAPYEKIVSHWFSFDEINSAFEQAEWMDRQPSKTRSMLRP